MRLSSAPAVLGFALLAAAAPVKLSHDAHGSVVAASNTAGVTMKRDAANKPLAPYASYRDYYISYGDYPSKVEAEVKKLEETKSDQNMDSSSIGGPMAKRKPEISGDRTYHAYGDYATYGDYPGKQPPPNKE